MHQNDRRFRSRMVADVDPVSVPLHKRLLVDHHSLRTWHRATVPRDGFPQCLYSFLRLSFVNAKQPPRLATRGRRLDSRSKVTRVFGKDGSLGMKNISTLSQLLMLLLCGMRVRTYPQPLTIYSRDNRLAKANPQPRRNLKGLGGKGECVMRCRRGHNRSGL